MEYKTKKEIIGRIWLWSESISKTKHLLEMSFRALEGKQDEKRRAEIIKTERILDRENYSESFPTWLECCAIYDAFVELAIIYFCQVFNSGRGQDGETAKSDKNFRDQHLSNILSQVFPTKAEMESFELLKYKIITARDKVIGHSDEKLIV